MLYLTVYWQNLPAEGPLLKTRQFPTSVLGLYFQIRQMQIIYLHKTKQHFIF